MKHTLYESNNSIKNYKVKNSYEVIKNHEAIDFCEVVKGYEVINFYKVVKTMKSNKFLRGRYIKQVKNFLFINRRKLAKSSN